MDKKEENAQINDLVINSRGMLSYDRSHCEILETQLDDMYNLLLDDFETQLQQLIRKKDIFAVVEGQSEEDALNLFNFEVSVYLIKMKEVTEEFTKRISRLTEEMNLISRHKGSLNLLHAAYEADVKLPSIDPVGDLCTRKYAALVICFINKMYTSQDGENFKLFDNIKHCYKCDAAVYPYLIIDDCVPPPPSSTRYDIAATKDHTFTFCTSISRSQDSIRLPVL